VQCGGFESEQLPEDGQVGPKHVAVDCDFNVVINYGEIGNSCIKDGSECVK
jgi:hypothetical protein